MTDIIKSHELRLWSVLPIMPTKSNQGARGRLTLVGTRQFYTYEELPYQIVWDLGWRSLSYTIGALQSGTDHGVIWQHNSFDNRLSVVTAFSIVPYDKTGFQSREHWTKLSTMFAPTNEDED